MSDCYIGIDQAIPIKIKSVWIMIYFYSLFIYQLINNKFCICSR